MLSQPLQAKELAQFKKAKERVPTPIHSPDAYSTHDALSEEDDAPSGFGGLFDGAYNNAPVNVGLFGMCFQALNCDFVLFLILQDMS